VKAQINVILMVREERGFLAALMIDEIENFFFQRLGWDKKKM